MINIIGQLFGIGAMAFLFSVYQQTNRKKLIFNKLCADFCWVIHYLLIGAYGGMIPNFVGIFRELVFAKRDEKKWARHIIWPFFFVTVNWILGISTFKSAINILPIAASAFATISLWCKNTNITKMILVPVCTAFLIYDIAVGSWIGIINESISLLSVIIYYITEFGGKYGRKKFNQKR